MSKIFLIGFQKTGTKSMAHALHALGRPVNVIAPRVNKRLMRKPRNPRNAILRVAFKVAEEHYGLQDSPCPFIYADLDAQFPGSKFILTTRDAESWLESYRNFFGDRNTPLRAWMYGVNRLRGNEEIYKEVYTRQNDEIRSYFADRPEDFCEADLSQGFGWVDLVNFLGRDFIGPFPRKNMRNP
jgi:hypothetical protein